MDSINLFKTFFPFILLSQYVHAWSTSKTYPIFSPNIMHYNTP